MAKNGSPKKNVEVEDQGKRKQRKEQQPRRSRKAILDPEEDDEENGQSDDISESQESGGQTDASAEEKAESSEPESEGLEDALEEVVQMAISVGKKRKRQKTVSAYEDLPCNQTLIISVAHSTKKSYLTLGPVSMIARFKSIQQMPQRLLR